MRILRAWSFWGEEDQSMRAKKTELFTKVGKYIFIEKWRGALKIDRSLRTESFAVGSFSWNAIKFYFAFHIRT